MAIQKTKRRGFTWDAEFKDYVAKIRDSLKEHGSVEMGNKELFFLCVAVGLKERLKRPVPARKTDSARLEDLRDEDFALLKAMVISEVQDFQILLEEDNIYNVVEEYGAGGLAFLAAEYDRSADFRNDLVSDFYVAILSHAADSSRESR
jgi:hypothetical protein